MVKGTTTIAAATAKVLDDAPANVAHAWTQEALFTELYGELKRLARSRLRAVGGRTYLDTTALVHDAYARLSQSLGQSFNCKGQFMAYCAQVMRSVIIDMVRANQAERRGGSGNDITLNTSLMQNANDNDESVDVLRIHEALDQLRAVDERLAAVVEMRYFAGFTEAETAEAMQLSPRTVTRLWERARALLRVMLDA